MSFSLKDIFENEGLVIFFHPIVSLKEREIIGLEALCRGLHPETGQLISPLDLFAEAERTDKSLELDRLCRKKALEAFAALRSSREILLFVNINASVLNEKTTGSGHFLAATETCGVEPERVCIEVVESKVNNPGHLQDFAFRYRESGFLIVIDDFGTEHSNLERLIQVKPDIIKIDKQIISGIDRDHYKQSVFKSICGLSERIGALSLAEGIETSEELHICHQLGADLFQGFYFAMPRPDFGALGEETGKKIAEAVESVNAFLVDTLGRRDRETKNYEAITNEIILALSDADADDTERIFRRFVESTRNIECLYLVDEKGIQVTETVCSARGVGGSARHALFQPAPRFADHSLKNYYYYIKHLGIRRYFTDPYLSLATGNLCRTMAVVVDVPSRKNCVLCIDFLGSSGEDGTSSFP